MSLSESPPIVNARFLTQNLTGVQRFASEISLELKKLDPRIRFMSPSGIKHTELAKLLEAQVIRPQRGHLWEQFTLPMWLNRQQKPLLINLGNTGPILYRNQIVTIHDMAFKVQPLWFTRSFQLWYDFLIPKIANRSRRVLTVSNSSKEDIVKYTGVNCGKIDVVYNAIPGCFYDSNNDKSETGVPEIELPEKYILYVGALNPRKNIGNMVEAFKTVQCEALKLLIVGEEHQSFADYQLHSLFKNSDGIISYPRLSERELIKTYQNALALINISYHEGFGLPLLEAMHLGCPVICSDIPVYREIFSNAATIVDPIDIKAIAKAIEDVTKGGLAINNKVKQGKQLASTFSYRLSAEKILDSIYNL